MKQTQEQEPVVKLGTLIQNSPVVSIDNVRGVVTIVTLAKTYSQKEIESLVYESKL